MSVQLPHNDLDPEQVFERYVETDPSICNHCFHRPLPEETDGIDIESKGVIGERVRTDDEPPAPKIGDHEHVHKSDGERVIGTEPAAEHSAIYDWQPRPTCPECGSVGMCSPDDTLSIRAASLRAIRLSKRLFERGIAHNGNRLVWFVRKAKRNEDAAGKDREIASNAVTFAIKNPR